MAKRVIITGAFGQLGEAVVQELQLHFDILATDIQVPKHHLHVCQEAKLDITDRAQVIEMIREFDPHVIVNLAAYTDVDGCERLKELAWNINVKGVEYLLEAIKGRKTKIIHISSDYVFDGEKGPYDEKAIPNPINYYGRTKLGSENAIRGSTNPWVIIRTNVLYGASQWSRASFVKWVVESLSNGKEIRVVDDQWGNPTWTGGLAEAIKMAIILDIKGIFNYGGAEFITRYEFARKIAKVFGFDNPAIHTISTPELNQEAKRPLRGGLITDKIEEVLGLRTYEVEYCLRKVKEGIIA